MKKFEILLAYWQRILFGQAAPVFLLEVFIRTLIIYIFLLFILGWLCKRMNGQLTILELSVMYITVMGSFPLYMKASGSFTLMRDPKPAPGLFGTATLG